MIQKFGASTQTAAALRMFYAQHPFFGYLIEGMKRHVNKNLKAYVAINVKNGYVHLHTHPEMDDLPIDQIHALIEHVCTHVLLQHLTIRRCLADPMINDLAEDAACNCVISKGAIIASMGGVTAESIGLEPGGTKEQYWDILMKRQEDAEEEFAEFIKNIQNPFDGNTDGDDLTDPLKGDGPDEYDQFRDPGEPDEFDPNDNTNPDANESLEDDVKIADSEPKKGEINKPLEEKIGNDVDSDDKAIEKILMKLDDHEAMRDGDSDQATVNETIRDLVKSAYSNAKSNGIGDMPGGIEQLIIDIIETKTMPWNIILRRSIRKSLKFGAVKTWTRENRIRPGLKQGKRVDYVCNLYVLMDTSGSISEKYISVFSNEMAIMKRAGHKITVVPCDTAVMEDHVQTFSGRLHIFPGRGGTDMSNGVEWILKNARSLDMIIILTDGETRAFEKPPVPVIWALNDKCVAPVDWGTHIYLKE